MFDRQAGGEYQSNKYSGKHMICLECGESLTLRITGTPGGTLEFLNSADSRIHGSQRKAISILQSILYHGLLLFSPGHLFHASTEYYYIF